MTHSAVKSPWGFEVSRDSAGNVPPLPAIFPDQMAPVVRTRDGERELLQMRWGFPAPPKVGNHPVTNVRNVSSPFWRAWLKPRYRCLVPLTSFSVYKDTKPRWLKRRAGCGDDRACLSQAYQERVRQLRGGFEALAKRSL